MGVMVIVILFCLRFIPSIDMGIFSTKRVDILSDIVPSKTETPHFDEIESTPLPSDNLLAELPKDSILHTKKKATPRNRATSTKDTILIEDFSEYSDAMSLFCEKLNHIGELNRPVRIAFFGDSFTESDIIVADVREQLQSRYGGGGVGYIPIAPNPTINTPTVKQTFSNWKSFSIINHYKEKRFTPIGFSYRPELGATATFHGVTYKKHIDSVSCMRILYRNSGISGIAVSINNKDTISQLLTADNRVNEVVIKDNIKKATLNITATDSLELLGVVMENECGITVDNYSIRGNTGLPMSRIDNELTAQLYELMQYDLVILQYGINAIENDIVDYSGYRKAMIKIIKNLQVLMPTTSFLLLSTPDRCTHKDGEFVTMDGVFAMVKEQKRIAKECGIAFWNMFEAMGGENGMVNFVDKDYGRKDYTHINHAGGKVIASSLVNALNIEAQL